MRVYLDIESRSQIDLRKVGVYVYAEHPTTEILMVCYQLDRGAVQTWIPFWGAPMPADLAAALTRPETRLVAHNASFERIMLSGPAGRRIGMPARLRNVALWDCTAARAACFGLPRTLQGACSASGVAAEKDAEGHRLMLQMCKPRKARKAEPPGVYWHDDDARMLRLAEYCARDVVAEVAIFDKLPDLPPAEREAWELTEEANDFGIAVDTALLIRIALLVEEAVADVDARISAATGGAVPRVSDHAALTRWLLTQGIDDQITDTAGKTSIGKAVVAALIEESDLDPFVRSVLCMRRDGGGAASKKWHAILHRMSDDGRIRGALVYCGAASTGRWSSRGAQLQNMPRGGNVDTEAAIRDVLDGADMATLDFIHGPVLIMAADLLRPAFVSTPDAWLARADYSQIEARVLAWMAGAEWKLDAFRAYDAGTGPDLYKVAAAGIYRVALADVTKAQRQIGKVGELALGFQGGAGAFLAMAKGYGVVIPREEAETIKVAWRETNPEAPIFWRALNDKAVECMLGPPGRWHPVEAGLDGGHATGIAFCHNRETMAMRLPSGRSILYWSPKIRDVPMPWGGYHPTVQYRAEDSVTKQWWNFTGYGGLFCENAVQGMARDIQRDSMRRARHVDGLHCVLTVHDEGIFEASKRLFPTREVAAGAVARLALTPCLWAPGLPVAVDASAGPRYVKA